MDITTLSYNYKYNVFVFFSHSNKFMNYFVFITYTRGLTNRGIFLTSEANERSIIVIVILNLYIFIY